MRYAVLLLVVGFLVCSLAYADVPRLINFQGRLTDAAGKFVADGSYSVTFSIYSVPSGGSALWTEAQSVTVTKGLFNVILGSVTPIPNTIFDSYVDTYLGIQVAADAEMTPRQRLTSLGYSYYALNSDKLDGLHASDFTSPVSDFGRLGVATDLYEGSTTLTDKYVNVAGPDSVYSTSGWAFKGKVSGSSSLFLRGIYGYGDNGSTGAAAGGYFETSTNGTATHIGALGAGYGSSSASTRGTEGDAFATSTGDATGIFGWGDNNSSGSAYGGWFYGSSSGSGTHYGVYSSAGTATSSTAYGSSNYAYSSNGPAYGTYGSASNSSTGWAYGGYFTTTSSGTGYHIGVYASGSTSSSAYARGVAASGSTSSSGAAYGGEFDAYSSGTGLAMGSVATSYGTSSGASYGSYGWAGNPSSGYVYGGYFYTDDTGTGTHYGVRTGGYGMSSAPTYGSYNFANNTSTGTTYGVYGSAANTSTGQAFGGYFTTFGSSGTGWHYGIYTQGTGTSSYPTYALYGDADNSSSGDAYGGYFITSNSGTGIHYGVRSDCYGATSAYTYGSYSKASNSSSGTAIGSYGYAQNSSTGFAYGGWFETDTLGSGYEHIGSVSRGYAIDGATTVGCFGDATNNSIGSVYGGFFRANSEGTGTKYGIISYANASQGYAGYFQGDVTITDSLIVLGTKSAAVKTDNGEYRLLYAQESPENWFEDFGEGNLVNGKAVIQIDSLFAQTVNTSVKYHVFPIPEGDCKGLFVTNRTATSFEIRELQGGNSNISFSYRIVAKRKGYENLRLAKMGGPTPEEVAAEQTRFMTEFEKTSASMKQEKPQVRPQTIESIQDEQNLKEEQIKMQQERLIRQKNREAEKQNIENDKQPMQAAK